MLRIPDRHRRLDDHHRLRIDGQHLLNDRLHRRSIKEILLRIIVRRRRDDDKISIREGFLGIQRRLEVDVITLQERRDIRINNRRYPLVEHLHLLRNNIQSYNLIMLCQKHAI